MLCKNKAFLVSLFIHLVLIGTMVYFTTFYQTNTYYTTTIHYGTPLAVSLIANPPWEGQHSHSNKKSNYVPDKKKQTVPLASKGDMNLNKQHQAKKNKTTSAHNTEGTGGSRAESTSEAYPVIENNQNNIINLVPPIYPKVSLALKQEGTVKIRVLVNIDGEIVKNHLHQSSGYKLLDNAVIKAANLWTVNTPPKQTSWIEVIVNFIIK